MLNGFETYTSDLNQYETETLLPIVVAGLGYKKGRANAVTNKQIVSRLRDRGLKINDARVRKLINHIRNNNILPGLIATSEGYYISTDPTEVNNYIESLVGRERAIGSIRRKFQEYAKTLI